MCPLRQCATDRLPKEATTVVDGAEVGRAAPTSIPPFVCSVVSLSLADTTVTVLDEAEPVVATGPPEIDSPPVSWVVEGTCRRSSGH